jgi:hypothetical protein
MMRARHTSVLLVAPLLVAKVVKTSTKTSKTNGAEECTYKTNKAQKEFKERDLRILLELTVQPVTDEVRSKLQNYRGASTKFRSVSEGAVRPALPPLGQVDVPPPS